MEYRILGNSDLQVSEICFGCWAIGGIGWGVVQDEDSIAALRRAFELGINFYDTADVYGVGHSEEILAEALGDKRDRIIIATKGGRTYRDGRFTSDVSGKHLLEACDASLKRLKTDVIDLYQLHWPAPEMDYEETMGAMVKLQEAGKIRCIGISNFSVEQTRKAMRYAKIVSQQPPYSMLQRRIETDLLPFCSEQGIGVMAYGPLGEGVLTGKYSLEYRPDENDFRRNHGLFQPEIYEKVDKLKPIAAKLGKTLPQLAVAWVLMNPAVTVAIVGAKTPAQIEDNVGGAGWKIPDEIMREIEEILSD